MRVVQQGNTQNLPFSLFYICRCADTDNFFFLLDCGLIFLGTCNLGRFAASVFLWALESHILKKNCISIVFLLFKIRISEGFEF